ncbi:hypothetical protein HTZ84_09755 [Haloterrigena sp. SYSU A558-1]|uniref:Uncharacterized protein n=1 Tax=Haloterrigena gelatinilytica TaxID=2741724 RepID=A0ABX2LB27_9EURY|nr:hypothetical protein [Haloterrigena gelatinilytica]NUC72590.1 hypothetical protein [Haloterrigena gelatinilytica]
MYDYNSYEQDSGNNNSGSDSDSSGGSNEPDKNLTITPYAPVEGEITRVFGNSNNWGQSLGVAMENVELVDGCLYHDPEKGKFKVFSWREVVGIDPATPDAPEVSADDANQFLVKNYGGTEKRYELVEAVVMANDDDPVSIGNTIMWYGGSDRFGPKSASKTLAKILTTYGREMVVDDSDIHNWLADTSGENVLRPDLQGRRFGFFEVKKQSNQSDRKYHHPIVKDAETGVDVTVQNANDGQQGTLGGGNAPAEEEETEAEPEAVADGGPAMASEVPPAIEDFISTCQTLGYDDEEKAETLLADLVEDAGNDLTENMVEEFGGEDAVVARVFQ